MAIFEFSPVELPALEDMLTPPRKKRLLGNIIALLLQQRFEVFSDEGGISKWAPLSKKYAAWKLKQHGGKSSKILSLTNALRQSFSASGPSASKPDGDGEAIVTDGTARIETHVPYAAIQNNGGTISKGQRTRLSDRKSLPRMSVTIPARPFDEFREKDVEDIEELTIGFVNGKQ